MWTSAISYVLSNTSNYNLMNTVNINNFMIAVLRDLQDDQKKKFIEQIKINIGMKYYEQLRTYIFHKLSDSDLLEYFK